MQQRISSMTGYDIRATDRNLRKAVGLNNARP